MLFRKARGMVGVAVLASLVGCANTTTLSQRDQRCLECALRGTADEDTLRRAVELLDARCTDGDPRSCSVVGAMYERGRGVAVDGRVASRYYRRACLGGNPDGCVNLARGLRDGRGGRTDRAGATVMFEMACIEESPTGCYELASLRYADGDVRGAGRAFAKACRLQHADACFSVATMIDGGSGDPGWGTSASWYQRGCRYGSMRACDRGGG